MTPLVWYYRLYIVCLPVCAQFACYRVGNAVCAKLAGYEPSTDLGSSGKEWWLSLSCLQFCERWNPYAFHWCGRYVLRPLEEKLPVLLTVPLGTLLVAGLVTSPFVWVCGLSQSIGYYVCCLALFSLFLSLDIITRRCLLGHGGCNDYDVNTAEMHTPSEAGCSRSESPRSFGTEATAVFLRRCLPHSVEHQQYIVNAW